MAAVEVTISGVLYDKLNRTMQNVVLIGEASLTGLGVGGGPMPPGSGGTPTHPIMLPGMPGWGDPHPEHPIVNPPGIWGGGNEGFPTPPIVIPPIQPTPPPDNEAVKPPPDDGGWGYFPEYGWGYFPKKGEAGPKGK